MVTSPSQRNPSCDDTRPSMEPSQQEDGEQPPAPRYATRKTTQNRRPGVEAGLAKRSKPEITAAAQKKRSGLEMPLGVRREKTKLDQGTSMTVRSDWHICWTVVQEKTRGALAHGAPPEQARNLTGTGLLSTTWLQTWFRSGIWISQLTYR
ncbi:hypothetical protein OH77DRAFT_232498 [Trametes cingulata]|nr:hypothetical protein OH77DRAFT_232498 [Trametes cingulata]